ncbi:UPF0481 protein At3g47200-like [Cornus florida]|uniref:UPF0481 protein At3g47200-like n=1 Tax=Cornus florida TaxID=4283 RepID=UPI00289C9B55|nr:UPF0481 protein At3g47200-like [Cornus florida]
MPSDIEIEAVEARSDPSSATTCPTPNRTPRSPSYLIIHHSNIASADSGIGKDTAADGMADQRRSSSGQETTATRFLESLDKKIHSSTNNFEVLKNYGRTWVSLIHRIPVEIRQVNEGAYTHSIVSIGPLHREAQHLQVMEDDKLSYMHCLFFRFKNYKQTQQLCVNSMVEMESFACAMYAQNEVAVKGKFAEMMLIDGCFIIELLYRNYNRRSTDVYITDPILNNIDPILNNYSMRSAVQHDLIRLENQIPFNVLHDLFNLTVATISTDDRRQPTLS